MEARIPSSWQAWSKVIITVLEIIHATENSKTLYLRNLLTEEANDLKKDR